MSVDTTAPPFGRLRERWSGSWASTPLVPTWSPASARRAARTTLVMPALFALAYKGFGNLQMALFAGFGSFATLVLVTFAGTRRDKLLAHLGMAVAGSALLIIGTLVNASTALAALVTVPVGFAVLFAGVTGPNAASAATGVLVAYVLPAASPGTMSMIPDRLAGWWLAAVVGTAAVLLLPTPSTADRVRAAVARLAEALADELEAMLDGRGVADDIETLIEVKRGLLATFSSTPFRPTGLAIRDQALANAVELLEWCTALVADTLSERPDLSHAPEPERALIRTTASVLRESGGLFAGGSVAPDLEELEQQRVRSREWLATVTPARPDFEDAARLSFHAHALSTTALAIGADALVAARLVDDDWIADARARWFAGESFRRVGRLSTLAGYAGTAIRHASVRSVWFVNSVRGALALAAAVLVADLSSVQHGFWVVLGTLSVLRTNASATGATALRAILGTTVGFVIGGLLLLVIGTDETALWIVFPIAVCVAAYAPGAAPFALGQAAFTVTVAVLFNLLVPVGWKVGELRVEDVAIGCAVSIAVGALIWPRGVAPLVGDDLADAYRTGANYLREAIEWVCGVRSAPPQAGGTALTAGVRLDEALRGFLAEQGTKRIAKEELWRLIGGTLRLRLTAYAISELPRECAHSSSAGRTAVRLEADTLVAWYEQLAAQLGAPRGQAVTMLSLPPAPGGGAATSRRTIWLQEHLDHLAESFEGLIEPAAHLAEIRREPWWR